MSKVEWKYVSPIQNDADIDALEIKYHYALPSDLKECIVKNNAGMPNPAKFDTAKSKNMVFGGLLSFNEGDADSVYDYVDLFLLQDGRSLKMFPFGLDPFGNFYCIKEKKVVFYDQEEERAEVIADTFTKFLEMLHN